MIDLVIDPERNSTTDNLAKIAKHEPDGDISSALVAL